MADWQKKLNESVFLKMKKLGHTQNRAAERIGVQQSQLNDWLHERKEPNRENEGKLRAYVDWIPTECLDCGAPLAGKAGTEDELGRCPDCLLRRQAEV